MTTSLRCYMDLVQERACCEIALEAVYEDLRLPAGAGDRPYTYLNMISSLDGKAVFGPPGTTWRFGSAIDHALFKQLRRSCDAILAGAGLMQVDDPPYPSLSEEERQKRIARGLRPEPLWIIASGLASIRPNLRIFEGGKKNVLVLASRCVEAAILRSFEAVAQVLLVDTPKIPWQEAGSQLRSRYGIQRLYSIGGPILNASMLESDALDELFFTLSPKIQGGTGQATMFEGQGFPHGQWPQSKLLSLYGSEDELFFRYGL